MNFLTVSPLYPEEKNFVLHRNDIGNMYIFIHFLTPVTANLKGKDVNIYPGGCVFFGMHAMQHFSSNMCRLLHDWFHADYTCGELMNKYGLENETVYYPSDSDEITRIITEIEMEYLHNDVNYKELADCLAEKLFIKLARSGNKYEEKTLPGLYQRDIFMQARQKIHMNFAENWSVENMAKLVNMSESRFYTLYKKIFGISPAKDLSQKRIQTAQALLMRNDITVEQAAKLTGYTNQYHFIRQFKQFTGTTPGKFKLLKE